MSRLLFASVGLFTQNVDRLQGTLHTKNLRCVKHDPNASFKRSTFTELGIRAF